MENSIAAVEKHQAFYNKQLKEYSDSNVRKDLWEKIIEEIKLENGGLYAKKNKNKVYMLIIYYK